ncbi:Eukaryotic translation initiation factor 3 subunit D [Hibiscus syriacus]|uniref:Eukaryotic translation initiation factor 3 subunit D n=1 Tax=Hibiscus syriacus TaxID=106335 RepID=A0A6A2WDI6_HIBSY|nr:Eukaryotic translation initiation factor 3 subunit D [Hibiscus syriacus]
MGGVFEVGAVAFNPDGWGPPESTTGTPLTDSPFDFSLDLDAFPLANDDGSAFRLVDAKPPPRPKFGPKWRFNRHRPQFPQRRDEEVEVRKREAEKERARRDRLYNLNRSNQNQQRREAAIFKSSVDIQPEWNMLKQIPFSTFSKLSFSVADPEDLLFCCALEYYNRSFDRITPGFGWDGNKVTFDEPNPFASEGDEVASVAYRYRRWKLDNDMYLVARCEAEAGDAKGADLMKLGYVTRVHPRDHFNHVILSVVGYKPRDFASQFNLNTSNMWATIKSIVDLCMKLNEGKYVVVKDPAKPQVRIYEVSADAFENDYVEEPLPEDEQVQPPTEDAEGVEANDTTNNNKEIEAQT